MLDQGELVAEGTHATLMQISEPYRELIKQSKESPEEIKGAD